MKILFPVFLFCVFFIACNPAKQINQSVIEKKEEGVKVKFPQQHIATPADVNYVYDYDQLYSPGEVKRLDSLLRIFEKSNLIAIKLVTLNSVSMQTADFDANNALLYKEWDKAHGGSGKVMVVTIAKDLQKSKADYGPFVAKLLSEAEVSKIIEANRPVMFQRQFFTATWNGLNQIMDTIRKNIR